MHHPTSPAHTDNAQLQRGIEEVAQTYDDLPYHSVAFTQTSPIRLHTIGTLFGQTPPDIATARVLEIGCAAGGNIIPWALAYPKARVVGIDISKAQVEEGQQAIAALGLTNIRIEQRSASDIPADFGEFDYIVCHGVYSWVPTEVQNAIFSIAQNHLSKTGIAYISYNTYPGWKSRELVRDAMRMRAPKGGANPLQQLSYAKGIVEFLAEVAPKDGLMHTVMTEHKAIVNTASVSYLAHEFLEIHNNPCYFKDFVNRAASHQLAYLAEAEPNSMFLSNYGAHVADLLLKECTSGQLEVEQYLDFITNRPFRQTLLMHTTAAKQTNYNMTEAALLKLHFRGHFVPAAIPANSTTAASTYTNHRGRSIMPTLQWQRDVLDALSDAYPGTVPVVDLIELTNRESLNNKLDVLLFLNSLLTTDLLSYATLTRPCAAMKDYDVAHMPIAYAPAVVLAKLWLSNQQKNAANLDNTSCAVVNTWYEHVPLTHAAALALTLTDGTRSCEQIQRQTGVQMNEFYRLGLIIQ